MIEQKQQNAGEIEIKILPDHEIDHLIYTHLRENYSSFKDISLCHFLKENMLSFKSDEILNFRIIPDFPDYRISNYGSIISLRTVNIKQLMPQKGSNTYLQVGLIKEGIHESEYIEGYRYPIKKTVQKLVHVLVAEVFIPNPEKKSYVDHINHNRHDNRVVNLRWTTQSQNLQNKSKHKNNSSGITGVSFCNGKWKAQITINYETIHLGTFLYKDFAIQARKEAEIEYFGEYANREN